MIEEPDEVATVKVPIASQDSGSALSRKRSVLEG
jgi:hypothetical protein